MGGDGGAKAASNRVARGGEAGQGRGKKGGCEAVRMRGGPPSFGEVEKSRPAPLRPIGRQTAGKLGMGNGVQLGA